MISHGKLWGDVGSMEKAVLYPLLSLITWRLGSSVKAR